jgi:hypothetical protein
VLVGVLFPTGALIQVLRGFAVAFPAATLRIGVGAVGGVAALVLEGAAGLGVSGGVCVSRPELG